MPLQKLSKPRRRRERHYTKGLMSKTIAVHVRYKSLYISLPSSAKQQREMTKFCVVYFPVCMLLDVIKHVDLVVLLK